MDAGWLSLVPFVVVILLAIWTKQVLPGLIVGLVVAAYLVKPDWLGGLEQMFDYLMQGLMDENNMKIIVFLYLFSGLIGLIKISGGIKGFVERTSSKIRSKKGALFLTWVSTLGTFSAPSFRIVTIAPIMRALLQRVKMTPQELGFVVETTASPIIAIVPIATAFVGYMTSVIDLALDGEGIDLDPYTMFLQSIPFNFFSIVIVIVGIYLSFFHHAKEPATAAGNLEAEVDDHWEDCHPSVAKELPSRPFNLLVPLALLIVLTLGLTYWDGVRKGYRATEAFIQADVLTVMVIALLLTIFVTFAMAIFQRIGLGKAIASFIDGGNTMMEVVVLLAVVWGLSIATKDLGFSEFVTAHAGWIPTAFVPPVLFLLGSALSYFIGSSWGTWGILMPLGVSLAQVSGTELPLVVGAVFASGVFGEFASPLSDNTNMLASILKLKVMPYSRFKFKPAMLALVISTVLYAIVPFVM